MSKTRLLMVAVLVGLIFVGSSAAVSAHILKQSNGISVVMHIIPADDPSANELTTIEFQYGSSKGNFSLSDYDVSYAVSADNTVVEQGPTEPAPYDTATTSLARIAFPRIDAYTLTLTGKPKNQTSPSFQMKFIIRVEHAANVPATGKGSGLAVLLLGIGLILNVVLLAWYMINKGKRYAE